MDIAREKKNLIDWLEQLDDERIINRIKAIKERGHFYPHNLSEEEIRERLKASEEDIKYGRVYTQEEVMKRFNLDE